MRKGLSSLAIALAAPLVLGAPPSKSHASPLAGTIASVDPAHRSLVVRESGGRVTRVVWTAATRISGGALKAGEKITLRWVAREGRKVATVVRVGEISGRPTPLASRSPTAAAPPPAPRTRRP